MADSKFRTVVSGTFSWEGGPMRPVAVEIKHAPEIPDADSKYSRGGVRFPTPHGPYTAPAALVVPPPPDYSTPRACSDRALERGTRDPWYLEIVRLGRGQGTYAPFRKAVEKAGGTLSMAADVRDTYVSKWVVVESAEFKAWQADYRPYRETTPPPRLTLTLASEVAPAIIKARKPRAKRAHVAA